MTAKHAKIKKHKRLRLKSVFSLSALGFFRNTLVNMVDAVEEDLQHRHEKVNFKVTKS